MVTLVCYVIGIPLDLLIGYFQEAYGAKTPAFHRYRMKRFLPLASVNRCFGTCFSSPTHHNAAVEISPLEVILKPVDCHSEQRNVSNVHRNHLHVHCEKDALSASDPSFETLESGVESGLESGTCAAIYADLFTPHEELLTIIRAAQHFFRRAFALSFSLNDVLAKERVSTMNVCNCNHLTSCM